jgi:hypothetical protein
MVCQEHTRIAIIERDAIPSLISMLNSASGDDPLKGTLANIILELIQHGTVGRGLFVLLTDEFPENARDKLLELGAIALMITTCTSQTAEAKRAALSTLMEFMKYGTCLPSSFYSTI